MKKYIVYEENSLQQISIQLDTPLEARLTAAHYNNLAERWDLKNKKYKWTTISEFYKKLLLEKENIQNDKAKLLENK